MKYAEVVGLLNETGFSPENLAEWLSVSSTTYRRWLKAAPEKEFPKEYYSNIAAGVYKLLNGKFLRYESARVDKFMQGHLPEFFQAAVGRLENTGDLFTEDSVHQDKITMVLSNLGNSSKVRNQVDHSAKNISKFAEWGDAWRQRIQLLSKVIKDKQFTVVDKLVAYGALFYLILPIDLVPDAIPVFGYVDDFGILGFAAAYYARKFPEALPQEKIQ